MKSIFKAVVLMLLLAISTGCSSTGGFDEMQAAALAAAGAGGAIGYNCTSSDDPKKKVLYAGAGAAGGLILGELLANAVGNEKVKEFNAGYSLGTSNAAKTQYWIIQKRQNEDEYCSNASTTSYKMYSFPGAAVDPEGNRLAPHDVVLRAVEK